MSQRSKAIVVGAGHWHFELYAPGWSEHHEVVGVFDPDPAVAAERARLLGAEGWNDLTEMLRAVPSIDVAYVLGSHRQMPQYAAELIRHRIPFVLEKPGATNLTALRAVEEEARRANVPAAAALVQRYGPLPGLLEEAGRLLHAEFSFIAGPPRRYVDSGNAWVLDRDHSGGGCLALLGVHFADLALQTLQTSAGAVNVRGHVSSAMYHLEVDDHASVLLSTEDGRDALLNIGWTFPDSPRKRLVAYTLIGDRATVVVDSTGGAEILSADGAVDRRQVQVDADELYPVFVSQVDDEVQNGLKGLPPLSALVEAMSVVDRGYSDSRGATEAARDAWQA